MDNKCEEHKVYYFKTLVPVEIKKTIYREIVIPYTLDVGHPECQGKCGTENASYPSTQLNQTVEPTKGDLHDETTSGEDFSNVSASNEKFTGSCADKPKVSIKKKHLCHKGRPYKPSHGARH